MRGAFRQVLPFSAPLRTGDLAAEARSEKPKHEKRKLRLADRRAVSRVQPPAVDSLKLDDRRVNFMK